MTVCFVALAPGCSSDPKRMRRACDGGPCAAVPAATTGDQRDAGARLDASKSTMDAAGDHPSAADGGSRYGSAADGGQRDAAAGEGGALEDASMADGMATPSAVEDAASQDAEVASDAGNDVDAGTSRCPESAQALAALEWAQWPMPNSALDAAHGAPNPQHYIDNGDGTVTDQVTGLVWQQNPPQAAEFTWEEAKDYCAGLERRDGDCGWRMPTRIELMSVVDYSRFNNATDPVFAVDPSAWLWTSTPSSTEPPQIWAALMITGAIIKIGATFTTGVRCVRAPARPPTAAQGRYEVTTETAYDTITRLTWQRSAAADRQLWADARSYCSGLEVGGHTWRLPTIKELSTLLDVARSAVALDAELFAGTPGEYWSATRDGNPALPQIAWLHEFVYGNSGGEYDSREHHVRCVASDGP
jgi:hypothetical protein